MGWQTHFIAPDQRNLGNVGIDFLLSFRKVNTEGQVKINCKIPIGQDNENVESRVVNIFLSIRSL